MLAAEFWPGEPLDSHCGMWLLLEAADTATEGRLAKNHGILLLRAIFSETLHIEDIKSSWFPGGRKGGKTNKQLLSDGLLVSGVKVFKADRAQCSGDKAKFADFGSKPDVPVREFHSTGLTASSSSSSSSSAGGSSAKKNDLADQ